MKPNYERYRLRKGLILGFHGCEEEVAKQVAAEGIHLKNSENDYDWLGNGIYFWENNPDRALEWASKNHKIKKPAVIGAVLDLGFCLDLTESVACDEVSLVFSTLKLRETLGETELPANRGKSQDLILRHLDCTVIKTLHSIREGSGLPSYASVRAAFHEGGLLYEGAGFSRRAHIQICVRERACILGYFKPMAD